MTAVFISACKRLNFCFHVPLAHHLHSSPPMLQGRQQFGLSQPMEETSGAKFDGKPLLLLGDVRELRPPRVV